MKLFYPPLRRSLVRGSALLLPLALACAARQAPPAASPTPTASELPVEPVAAQPAAPPPAPEEPRPSASTDSIVTLIAKPGLWPLDVDSARRVLEALGPVEKEQSTASSLELVGGPFGALDRFDVAYALDDQQYWVFGSAGFLLEDPDPTQLYRSVRARLTELLGKPLWTERENDQELPTTGWDIGEAMTLSLASRTEGDQRRVMIAIAEQDEKR
jgi:hypothetical protein